MSTTLFLSHQPHEAHQAFADAIGARTHPVQLAWYVRLTKRIPKLGYLFPLVSALYSLTIHVREDVLLVDGGSSLYVAAALKRRRPSLKLIYLDADLLFYTLSQRPESATLRAPYIGSIDAAISVSERSAGYLKRFCSVPVRVCPPFPKAVHPTDVPRKPYGLYVGRLDPEKRIDRIVEYGLACPHIERLIIVGDGSMRSFVEQRAEENPKLEYIGFREDVAQYYSEATFLIHLPDYDPHPCTLMEAALCGCFPLFSEQVGARYLFDERFTLDDPEDFEAIDKKMLALQENETASRTLLAATIEKIPTKERACAQFVRSFKKLLEEVCP